MDAVATGGEAEGTPSEAVEPAVPSVFRRERVYFSIAFEGESFRLRDTKGLRYLAHLLAHPGREVHAIDLVVAGKGDPHPAGPAAGRTTEGVDLGAGGAGEVLDPQARDPPGAPPPRLRGGRWT